LGEKPPGRDKKTEPARQVFSKTRDELIEAVTGETRPSQVEKAAPTETSKKAKSRGKKVPKGGRAKCNSKTKKDASSEVLDEVRENIASRMCKRIILLSSGY
jgi:hypothetical protein